MQHIEILTQSPEQTAILAEKIGKVIPYGTVIAAFGDLGMGKTLFAAALARGMGVTEQVTSPTFIYYNEYLGRIPFCHIDAYRLENISEEEQEQLGLIDCFAEEKTVFVEWPQFIAQLLPKDTIKMQLSRGSCDQQRLIEFDFDPSLHSWLEEVL